MVALLLVSCAVDIDQPRRVRRPLRPRRPRTPALPGSAAPPYAAFSSGTAAAPTSSAVISARRARSSGSRSSPSASNASRRPRHGQRDVEHPGPARGEDLARLRLGPDGAEDARARADHRHRPAPEAVGGERPRGPVERVLELSRDRVVVLGRRDQDRVGPPERPAQLANRLRAEPEVQVRIVGGMRSSPFSSRNSASGGSPRAAARRSRVS
jgi:hypothetical protein